MLEGIGVFGVDRRQSRQVDQLTLTSFQREGEMSGSHVSDPGLLMKQITQNIMMLAMVLIADIVSAQQDIDINQILAPASCVSDVGPQSVTVQLINNGVTNLNGLPVTLEFSIDGGANFSFPEVFIPTTLNTTGNTESYTFSELANLNFGQAYAVVVRINPQVPGDNDLIDLLNTTVTVVNTDFAVSATTVAVGAQVNFTDTTMPLMNAWSWDFGDGNTSNAQSPSHTYTDPGDYTVTLDTSNGSCSGTNTQQISVEPLVPVPVPAMQVLTGEATLTCPQDNALALLGSEVGFDYYLRNDGDLSVVDGPVTGTGSALGFQTGVIGETADFHVFAANPGFALDFDGVDDDVVIPHSNDFNFSDGLTIEAWIQPDDITVGFQEIFRKENNGSDRMLLGFQDNGTILSFGIETSDDGYTELDVPINAADYNGQWVHIVATFDDPTNAMRLYRNGVELGNKASNGAMQTATSPSNGHIGSNSGATEFFDGQIAALRIWNTAPSTQTEVDDLLRTGQANLFTGQESGLVAYHAFYEGAGTVLTDVANNNHGIINDALWTTGMDGGVGAVVSNAVSITQVGTCEQVQYTLAKATGLQSLIINNATSAEAISQYFNAPQPITVYGAEFYAFKTAPAGPPVNLQLSLYLADTEFLPTGTPLATTNLSVAHGLGGGTLDEIRVTGVFSSSITVSQPYVIVVVNPSATDVSLVLNDYTAIPPDGGGEFLAGANISGNWLRGSDVSIGGMPLDADALFEPLVSYDLITDFIMTPAQDDGSHMVSLTNNSSPILSDRMYNQVAFLNAIDQSHEYDMGDGTVLAGPDASHTYRCGNTYQITKTDTLFGWQVDVTDSETKSWGNGAPFDSTVYVDLSASGTQTGCDWPNAFNSIQPAVDVSLSDGAILVAEGSYMITDEITINEPLNIRGGFPAGGGTQNIDNHPTIIDAFESITANRQRVINATHAADNLYLEGLTLQNGFDFSDGEGGGIRTTGDLRLLRVIIRDNNASNNAGDAFGGAIYTQTGHIMVANSQVIDNTVFGSSNASGGIYSVSGNVTLVESTLSGNEVLASTSFANGGGIVTSSGDITLVNSTVNNNRSRSESFIAEGGGLFSNDGVIYVVNSLIYANQAATDSLSSSGASGGGVRNNNGSVHLINSAVVNNTALSFSSSSSGGGVAATDINMQNSLLWDNLISNDGGVNFVPSEFSANVLTTSHSLIKSVDLTAENGLDASDPGFDPLFSDEMNGDYNLQLGSPLIDAGDINHLPADDFDVDGDADLTERIPLDLAGMTRELGMDVDIGPFEFQTEYLVGGQLTGLLFGNEITLQNNAGDDLNLMDNGAFVFSSPVAVGDDYDVTVLDQPNNPIQPCVVSNESGTISNQDITDVMVVCEVGNDLIFRDGF